MLFCRISCWARKMNWNQAIVSGKMPDVIPAIFSPVAAERTRITSQIRNRTTISPRMPLCIFTWILSDGLRLILTVVAISATTSNQCVTA